MNLIFIYGPPASGKLTIAKELADMTGYKLFHNHQTRNIVHELYPLSLDENYGLVDKLRLDILKYAARHSTNIIFTYVHDDVTDTAFVDKVVKTVEAEKGNVLFVETTATRETLLHRVNSDSRKQHKKLTDKEILERLIDADTYKSLPYEEIFRIDTSDLSAKDSAALIAKQYNL